MAGEDERREALKRLCGFSQWAGKPPGPESTFTCDFFFPAAALPEWRVLKALAPSAAGLRRVRRYILEPAGAKGEATGGAQGEAQGGALDLMSFECPSWADAREAVIDYMAGCATGGFRPGADLQYEFGEVAFGGRTSGGMALFVRGNMFVVVRRALAQPHTDELARCIDRLLAGRPGDGDRGGKVPPEVVRFEALAPLAEGKRVPLELSAQDPLGRPVWHQLFVRGGEVGRADDRLYLAPGAGDVRVEAFTFNENGHWARRALTTKA